MLSEAGEHLLGLISALRAGICVPQCANDGTNARGRSEGDKAEGDKAADPERQGAGHPRALRHLRVMAARHGFRRPAA
jgi:hypothetical protein